MTDVHAVRGSERQAKRRCKQAWQWAWREGWQPVVTGQALEFGTALHAGMQAIYGPQTWTTTTPEEKLATAIKAFVDCCHEQRDKYLAAIGQTRLTWSGKDDYDSRVDLGTHMLEYYVNHVHVKEDYWFRPVKTEIRFQAPIYDESGNPIRCWNPTKCGQIHGLGAPVVVEGRIDALMEDIEHGGYVVFDWKSIGGDKAIDGTEKNSNRFSREDLVWMHDQLTSYCAALRYGLRDETTGKLGLDVRGFVLAELRKGYPKPPAELRRRRNGGLFSQDRNMETTAEIFESHVREHDFVAYAEGTYNDFLEFLEGPDGPIFHKRFRRPKSPEELQIAWRNVAEEVMDLVDKNVRIYPAPGPITCPRCAFRGPCEMKMRGYDYQFTLESDYEQQLRYPEATTEDSTK